MKIKPYIECRLSDDWFWGNCSCGQSMTNSQTSAEIAENAGKFGYDTAKTGKASFSINKRNVGDAQRYSTTIKNTSTDTIGIELISSFAAREMEFDKIYRMQTYWSAEGQLKVDTIESLYLNPSWLGQGMRSEKFFNLGSMPIRKYFPFVALENSKTGEFVGILLACSTSWQFELISCDNELYMSCGLADYETGHFLKNLEPGEEFTTPEAIVAVGNSIYDVCDKLVKAQIPDISPVDSDMGIMFNEYCTTWGDPSEENVDKLINVLSGRGFKYFVIDCGWYKKTEHWYQDQGDWDLNKRQFPNGMKAVSDKIRAAGMIPGIWFEFEVAGPGADVFKLDEHLVHRNGKVLLADGRKFFDMTDPWVIDYLSEKVIKFLKDNNLGYMKVDYNGTIGLGVDGSESLGEGLRKHMEAAKAFYRKIKAELPDLVLEVCSSGGHRLVTDFLELASQASFSDAHETLYIPCIAANLHRVVRPEQSQIWAVMRKDDDIRRIQYSLINTLLGRMCLSGDMYDLNEEQWDEIRRGMDFYNRASEIIQKGKTVLIENEVIDLTHPKGNQIVIREYNGKKLVICHRFENSKEIEEDFIKNNNVILKYGLGDKDFTARAYILE